MDLLSLIFFGIEFQKYAPSYIKVFSLLVVRGCDKQSLLEIFRSLSSYICEKINYSKRVTWDPFYLIMCTCFLLYFSSLFFS